MSNTIPAMSTQITPPDYSGGSLLNLVAELEHRLTGSSVSTRLHRHIADDIPAAATYVLVVMDGLGAGQLRHPAATTLAQDLRAVIDAPFPTTTTVSLATIATGLSPARHGLLGYQLHLPETIDPDDEKRASVVNTIKWTRLWGTPVEIDTTQFLPSPNLWERLREADVEPITIQPAGFAGSALSRVLYRGCRFEGVHTVGELVAATTDLAAVEQRLVVVYLPQVDFAAHVGGQAAAEYDDAVRLVDNTWSSLRAQLPPGVVMVGVADHGHADVPAHRQIGLPRGPQDELVLYGDSRAMFVRGNGAPLAAGLPATWIPAAELEGWWGPGPAHPQFAARRPDGVLYADDDHVLLHRHSDTRMIGHHGALSRAEREIPLLVCAGN